MKKLIVALAAAVSFAGVAQADAAATFASKCASCHGKDGKGSPVGVKMGAKDLAAAGAEADVVAAITNGKGKMAGFKGKLSDDEIKAVAKFVKGGLK